MSENVANPGDGLPDEIELVFELDGREKRLILSRYLKGVISVWQSPLNWHSYVFLYRLNSVWFLNVVGTLADGGSEELMSWVDELDEAEFVSGSGKVMKAQFVSAPADWVVEEFEESDLGSGSGSGSGLGSE